MNALHAKSAALTTLLAMLLVMAHMPPACADDPLPVGLEEAIGDPGIPTIVDASIVRFNREGHGEIKVHAVYKPGSGPQKRGEVVKGKKVNELVIPKWIRGYGSEGTDRIAPLRVVVGGKTTRFLFFLDGDLLYSTYNNRFPIRESKNGKLEIGIGFNGGGAPWKPLNEMLKLIPVTPERALDDGDKK